METEEMLKLAEATAKSIDNVRRTLDPNHVYTETEKEQLFNPLLNIKPPVVGKSKSSAKEGNLIAENILLKKQMGEKEQEIKSCQQKIADLYAIVENSKEEFLTSAESFYADQFLKLQRKVWEAITSKDSDDKKK